jgi:hypothetical protein
MGAMKESQRLAIVEGQRKRRLREAQGMTGRYSAEHGDDSGYFAAQKNAELGRLGDKVTELVLEVARLKAAQAWQPIATAPKDGSKIILAKIAGHPAHVTAFWWAASGSWSAKYERWWDGVEPCGFASPSHWMQIPLPLPMPEGEPDDDAKEAERNFPFSGSF